MHVINESTGKKHTVIVSQIDAAEIAQINKTKRFAFNWNKEKHFSVYKLTLEDSAEPIGMLSIAERPDDYALEIRLLASSYENVGPEKIYGRIAGCLIAYACRESFKLGYDGFVCLKPKTKLEAHYIKRYGLQSTKLFLVTEGINSIKLIKEYYEN